MGSLKKGNGFHTKVKKFMCVLPGMISGIRDVVANYARSEYSRKVFPGVNFGPLAFANSNCALETPCRIDTHSRLINSTLGKHSYCCSRCFIAFAKIGRFCSIGDEVIIGTWSHPTNLVSTFPGFYSINKFTINYRRDESIVEIKPVTIGNDVWIGHRAIVMGGIRVGDGAIIGAGAVVTKNVEPYDIVAGVPARIIRKRFTQDIVNRLLKIRWWDLDDDALRRCSHLIGDPEAFMNCISKQKLNKDEEFIMNPSAPLK